MANQMKPVFIYYVGDHDPSGVDIPRFAAALSRLLPAKADRWRRHLLADRGSFTRTAEGGLVVLLHGKVMAHAGPELVRAAFGSEGGASGPPDLSRPARGPSYSDAMRRLAVLNLAQRIVVVVALAAALRIFWMYLAGLMWTNPVGRSGGWYTYTTPGGSGFGPGLALLAIALIAAWACASVWVLGLSRIDRSSGPDSS